MEDTPTTRAATARGAVVRAATKNPTAPGLRYSVLLSLNKRGLVTADSVRAGRPRNNSGRRATQSAAWRARLGSAGIVRPALPCGIDDLRALRRISDSVTKFI